MSQQSQYVEKKTYSSQNTQQSISESNLKRDYYQPQSQYSSKDDGQPQMKFAYQKQRSQNNQGQYYQSAQQPNQQSTNSTAQQFRNESWRDNESNNSNNSYQSRRKNDNDFAGNVGSYVPQNQGISPQQGGSYNQRQTQSSYQNGSNSNNYYVSKQDSRNYTNNVYVPLNNNPQNLNVGNNNNELHKKNGNYANNMNGNSFNSQQNGNYAKNNYQQQGKYNSNNGSNTFKKVGGYQQVQYVAQNQMGTKQIYQKKYETQNYSGQNGLSSQSSQENDRSRGQEETDSVNLRNYENMQNCDGQINQNESEKCISQDELAGQDQQIEEDNGEANGIRNIQRMEESTEKVMEGEQQVGLNHLAKELDFQVDQKFRQEDQGESQNIEIEDINDIRKTDIPERSIQQEEQDVEFDGQLVGEEKQIKNEENQEQQISMTSSQNEQDFKQANDDLEDYNLIEFESEWVIWMCFSAEQSNHSHGLQNEKSFLQNNQALLSFKTLRELGLILSNSRFSHLSDFFTFRQTPQFQFSAQEDSPYRYIDAICFFKKGIKPIWEDDCNSYGQDIQAKFTKATVEQIDDIYCFFISSVFSEEFPFHESMNGFRFVDKGKNTKKSGVRLEVWFNAITQKLSNDIYDYFKNLLDQKWVNTVLKWEEHNKKVVQTTFHQSKYH